MERILVNQSQAAAALGCDRSTVARAIRSNDLAPVRTEGRAKLFDLLDLVRAAPHLIGLKTEDDEPLDLTQERARVAKNTADKLKIEVEVLKGNVFPAEMVGKRWGDMVANFRQRMVSLAPTLAARVVGLTVREVEAEAKDLVYEALDELKEYDPADYVTMKQAEYLRIGGDRDSANSQ